jgi:hypothetical protein
MSEALARARWNENTTYENPNDKPDQETRTNNYRSRWYRTFADSINKQHITDIMVQNMLASGFFVRWAMFSLAVPISYYLMNKTTTYFRRSTSPWYWRAAMVPIAVFGSLKFATSELCDVKNWVEDKSNDR